MKLNITPDKQKAKSLHQMSITTFNRLKETNKEKYPSNTLKDYYDIIKELMEALNFLDGIKLKGESAHYETIELICTKYQLSNPTRIFLQDLRGYRNRIAYEGFNIKKEYIKTNAKKIEKIIEQLRKLVENKL